MVTIIILIIIIIIIYCHTVKQVKHSEVTLRIVYCCTVSR